MSDHVTPSQLELYVIGALDDVSVARVDAHVAACGVCMGALAREASLEMAFEQVALASARTIAKRSAVAMRRTQSARAVAVACAVGGALSLAAAWMIWVVPGSVDHGASVASESADDDATTASLDSAWRDRVLDGG